MATTETLRSVLRTSRGRPILKLQSAEQPASLALDVLSLGSRAALGGSFLLSVSDRLGFYGNPGERGVSWGTFERFLGYAAKVNAFVPAWMIPFLGTAATVLELLLGVTLVLGEPWIVGAELGPVACAAAGSPSPPPPHPASAIAARIANEERRTACIVLCFMVTMSNKFCASYREFLHRHQVIAVRRSPRSLDVQCGVAVQKHLCTPAREHVHATA